MRNWLFHLFFIFLIVPGCKKQSKKKWPPVGVIVMKVEPKTVPADFKYVGVAKSSHIVQIRARVEGYLESIDYVEGGMVEKGELMFVLDKRPFIAKVESARGALDRQRAVLWNAEQTKDRMVPLYEQNAVSQRDLDNALARELSAKANVLTATANLYDAKLNLGFASIQAPVKGLAGQAKYRVGALISPGEQNLLTTVYVIDPIWVNFNVSDIDLLHARRKVQEGLLRWPENMKFQLEAILSDGTVLPAEGTIDFTNPAVQESTGTMLIRGVFPNPYRLISPGQFVEVVIRGAVHPNAILVPQTAVVQGEQGTFVYVVKEGKAHVQPVKPGVWYHDYWIMEKGLKQGDLVVARGVNKIQNNSAVSIQGMVPSAPTDEQR